MEDRDHYKERWKKLTGYKERTSFRLPAYSSDDDDGGAYLQGVRPKRNSPPWHPVLIALLTFFICAAVYLLLKLIIKFAS